MVPSEEQDAYLSATVTHFNPGSKEDEAGESGVQG